MAEEMVSLETIMESYAQEIEDQLMLASATTGKKTRSKYPKKLNQRHLEVMRWFIENPGGKQYECAKALGYSPTWISRIANSRQYRAFYKQLLREKNHAMATTQMAMMLCSKD